MSVWNEEQVVAVAPDGSSLAAARKLAKPGPWSETGSNESLVWGQCQGSGKKPYQVSVDILAPAYRCSCPSRKFPCKHAIALLLLWAAGHVNADGMAAEFAAEWANERAIRAEAAATRKARTEPVDPEKAAQRAEERVRKMDAGVEDFLRWLTDLSRTGLADAKTKPYGWWDATAARLVDAQLPGLAERVRETAGQINATPDWAQLLLHQIGRWYSLAVAWQRRDQLDDEEQAALRTALGWPTPTAEIRSGPTVSGHWTVLGAHRSEDGPLLQQRTWLLGPDEEVLLLLDTAGPGQALGLPQLAGSVLQATLARCPGPLIRRGLIIDSPEPVGQASGLGNGTDIRTALGAAAQALGKAPWRDLYPATLRQVTVVPGLKAALIDGNGAAIALVDDGLRLAARTGGQPCEVFGEFEDGRFRVLSALIDSEVVVP